MHKWYIITHILKNEINTTTIYYYYYLPSKIQKIITMTETTFMIIDGLKDGKMEIR